MCVVLCLFPKSHVGRVVYVGVKPSASIRESAGREHNGTGCVTTGRAAPRRGADRQIRGGGEKELVAPKCPRRARGVFFPRGARSANVFFLRAWPVAKSTAEPYRLLAQRRAPTFSFFLRASPVARGTAEPYRPLGPAKTGRSGSPP